MTTQEALHKALKVLNCLNTDRPYETAWVKGAITACEEALQSQEQKWQELSDDEIANCTLDKLADEYDLKFARAILAKAKEKNT